MLAKQNSGRFALAIPQIIICLLCLIFSVTSISAQRNLVTNELNRVGVQSLVSPEFHQFPLYKERKQWEDIPQFYKDNVIKQADQYLGFDWPTLKASFFLEYYQTGNRSHFEAFTDKRREVLSLLVIAECIEHKGRYLDDIINGVWTTCEQSYWGVPAHLSLQKKKYGLPDVQEPTVDLFSAETASIIAWTYYFLGERLDSISPAIGERMIFEMERRIIEPNLTRNDFWWMGFGSEAVNNWNPWIVSNWLISVMIMEKDAKRKEASLKKIALCLDNFLNPYPEDGGCDEGPSYWGRSGGSLFDCLELLYQASNKSFDLFKDPLVKKIGEYFYKVHIDDGYYVNFADASARMKIEPAVVYGYGERTSNDTLMQLGTEGYKSAAGDNDDIGISIYRTLQTIFNLRKLQETRPAVTPAAVYWLSKTQVLIARSSDKNSKGLFLGAQGGHNNESHNHNDVGNFIVYYDGKPALIDVGVETYTSKTFSDKRYEIWTMQSAFHNCPTVNGVMQSPGREFEATDVHFNSTKNVVSYSMNIDKAYPATAGIKKWKRTWLFNRNRDITLTDDFSLSTSNGETFFTLMTPGVVDIQNDKIVIAGEGFKLNVAYDKNQLTPDVEPVAVTDERLRLSWDEKIYRIKLHLNKSITAAKVKLIISGETK